MLKEFEFYHGIVFARMLHGLEKEVSLKPYPSKDNASYVVNGKIGIYIKFSTKRLSPWRFSFQKRHEEEILEMKQKIGEVFLLLVCHDDGIVTLDFEEFKKILNEGHGEFEWISAARNRREMYSINGSDGKLEFKIGKDDFPRKIFRSEPDLLSQKVADPLPVELGESL
jgi:hypothetical protein